MTTPKNTPFSSDATRPWQFQLPALAIVVTVAATLIGSWANDTLGPFVGAAQAAFVAAIWSSRRAAQLSRCWLAVGYLLVALDVADFAKVYLMGVGFSGRFKWPYAWMGLWEYLPSVPLVQLPVGAMATYASFRSRTPGAARRGLRFVAVAALVGCANASLLIVALWRLMNNVPAN